MLYAGQVPDASNLLQSLLEFKFANTNQYDLFHTNLLLASRCLAAYPTVRQRTLRKEIILRLFDILDKTEYSLMEQKIIETLIEIGGKDVNLSLIEIVSNEKARMSLRQTIISELGQVRERSIVPHLVSLLLKFPNNYLNISEKDVFLNLAQALADLKDRLAAPQLMDLLLDTFSYTFLNNFAREAIVEALGKLGDKSVALQLVPLLVDHSLDLSIREKIVNTLGQIGDGSVALQLVPLLIDHSLDLNIRENIVGTLGRIGDGAVALQLVPLLVDSSLDEKITITMTSTDDFVGYGLDDLNLRAAIAYILGRIGDTSIVSQLVPLFLNESLDLNVRGGIAHTLISLKERSLAKDFVKFLSEKKVETAFLGLIAYDLYLLEDKSVIPQLVSLLLDESNHHMNNYIMHTIEEIGDKSVVPQLISLFSAKYLNSFDFDSLVYALDKLGDRSVASQLFFLLADNSLSKMARSYVAIALAGFGYTSVIPQLVSFLLDESLDADERGKIAYALGRLGDKSVTPQLISCISNTKFFHYSPFCSAIFNVLPSLANDDETVKSLIEMLFNADQPGMRNVIFRSVWVICRQAGIRVLIENGNEGKKAILTRTLNYPDKVDE
ncbi:HEAT repeat domain-containing protein [Ktedonobacter robiniae]|uniref:HEAT repeat domain-containing protein n=1 Tax=Ktedonobacter robiniae TaxID=2778365 RepID=A0ABQ3URE9_9CHLR|nr:hypothetical protein [Ktedonobacter robiniae]GHO55299.1 hypothetical protein KSB_37740 [Ktedonobacter robiniae]